MASSTSSETPRATPRSRRVYHSTLIPARSATSSRRSPGTRRFRPYIGTPAQSGESFARRVVRNWRISSALLMARPPYAPSVPVGRHSQYPDNACLSDRDGGWLDDPHEDPNTAEGDSDD